ncbi:7TM GPCR protein [Aphelenchoides avenae]|nr:7TM GPCR protein [Aphelenchus avenae]
MNLVLLSLTLHYTRQRLAIYKTILMMTCIGDLLLSSVVLLVQPVIFFTQDSRMLLISNGFIGYYSPLVAHVGLAVFCVSLHGNVICIVLQFFVRYKIVCKNGSEHTVRYAMLAVIWCCMQSAIAVWTFAFGQDEQTQADGLNYLRDLGWTYDRKHVPFPTLSGTTKALVHHGFYISSCVGGYALIVYSEFKIIRYLSRHGASIRASTRQMHAQVNRALIALAVAPLVASIGPILAIIGINLVNFAASASTFTPLTMVITSITLVNPITTIFFVRPYRNALLSMLGCGNASVDPTSSTACDTGKGGNVYVTAMSADVVS